MTRSSTRLRSSQQTYYLWLPHGVFLGPAEYLETAAFVIGI